MSIAESALSHLGVITEKVKKANKIDFDEIYFFENFGPNFMSVELTRDGGVLLSVEQMRLFKDRDGMKDCFVERQKDGRYLVKLTKVDGL